MASLDMVMMPLYIRNPILTPPPRHRLLPKSTTPLGHWFPKELPSRHPIKVADSTVFESPCRQPALALKEIRNGVKALT